MTWEERYGINKATILREQRKQYKSWKIINGKRVWQCNENSG